MADLPAKPSLDHLRRQARDLVRVAQAGDSTAAGRIRAVAGTLTLASAQLARPGTRTGWAPLHAASTSRWYRLEAARAEGLLAVARMLLDAGADANGRTGEAGLADVAGRCPRAT